MYLSVDQNLSVENHKIRLYFKQECTMHTHTRTHDSVLLSVWSVSCGLCSTVGLRSEFFHTTSIEYHLATPQDHIRSHSLNQEQESEARVDISSLKLDREILEKVMFF